MIAALDLNEFVEVLEEKNMLQRITKQVDVNYELASIAVKSERRRGGALLFESVKGYRIPVVTNLYSEMERVCVALGVDIKNVHDFFLKAFREQLKPVKVRKGRFGDIEEKSIDNLPILLHSIYDAGRYITGILTAKEGKMRALQFARFQVKGPNKLVVRIEPDRRIREIAKGKRKLDVAIVIGAPPAVEFAAAVRGLGYDKLELAGALQGKPVEVVKCNEVECEVPARSQIVIEGVLNMWNLEVEGPFAEFTGYYSPPQLMPVVEVARVYRKEDAFYRTIVGGSQEHLLLSNITREAFIYDSLKKAVPGVIDVYLPPFACGFIAILSIKRDSVKEARNALLSALSAHPVVKYAIVVDEDINIRDEREVLWALATRSGGDEDIIVVPKTFGHVADPASNGGMVNKVGIDATFPPEKREKYKRVEYADSLVE